MAYHKLCLRNKVVPMAVIETEQVYALLEIKKVYEYTGSSNKTNKVVGYAYTVANIASYEKYTFKVPHVVPLMPPEELQAHREMDEKVFVEFENASVKLYWSTYSNSYQESFTADNILLVRE